MGKVIFLRTMKIFALSDYQFPIIGCYCLFFAMFAYWISLALPKNKILFQLGTAFLGMSNVFFAFTLGIRWLGDGYFPLSNLYESLIFLSWALSSLHLVLEFQTKSRLIGAISTPILFFMSGFSSFTLPVEMQKSLPLVPSLQSNWLMMHVSMMMISYATLILGSLLSLFYFSFATFFVKEKTQSKEEGIGQSFSLEQTETFNLPVLNFNSLQIDPQRFPSFSKLSLLETIDVWSYRIIGLGFPFLTIGIISGAVWANEAWGSYWSWDPKETWAFITWLVFAIYLHSRLIKGWQGKKAAILGSCGFFVIWICYLGVNFLGKGLHSYGWVV
jgi:cytochrome c-type biogenesis protein CcsB